MAVAGADDRVAGAHTARRAAVDTALAVGPVDPRRPSPPRSPAAARSSRLGSVEVGLGGLFNFLRITALSIVLLGLGALVSWTTNVAEIAPAVATLGRPLRPLRIPIDDWAVAVALALRAFPMLIDEFRVLYAARRLRPKQRPPTRRGRHRQLVGRGHRPARRGDHGGAAASRRDGRRDHRAGRGRSDLCGALQAETA